MTAAVNYRVGTHIGPLALGSASNVSLNGSGIGVAFIVHAQTTTAITKVRFRYGARTGTPPAYVLTIEGVDASGNPDGTDKGGGSPTAKIFTPPADTTWDALYQEITLTNSYTPANCSELLAITIRYSSGTVDGSNLSSITRGISDGSAGSAGFPFASTLSAGSWTKQSVPITVAWTDGTTTFGTPIQSAYTTTTAGTNGHRSGMYFTLPSGFGTTYTVKGLSYIGRTAAAGNTCKLAIWDEAGTVLASVTLDGDVNTSPANNRQTTHYFDTPVTLSYGTKYYAGVEVLSSSTVAMNGVNVGTANDMLAYPNGSTKGIATYNGSAWTDSTTIYPLCDLILSDITVPSGGGGALHLGSLGQTGIGAF